MAYAGSGGRATIEDHTLSVDISDDGSESIFAMTGLDQLLPSRD